jgi:hypothetical protein
LIYFHLHVGINQPIMSSPNEVILVMQVGSFMTSLLLACYKNTTLISLTSQQAASAGKEAVKMASWLGRRSSSNLRTLTLGSDKGRMWIHGMSMVDGW